MTSVKIRQLEIGAGMPKICVPIVEKTEDAVLKAARRIIQTSADLVEWRVDWFEEIFDLDKIQNVLGNLREILADRPLLFTCRTEALRGQPREPCQRPCLQGLRRSPSRPRCEWRP